MKIIDVPYFLYSGNDFEGIRLENENIEEMLKKIENNGNILDIIPNFRQSMPSPHIQMHFLYGKFVNKSEIRVSDRTFYEKFPKQIGKLMVPYYNIRTREDMISRVDNSVDAISENEITLKNYPYIESFYGVGNQWLPFYPDRVLKLSEKQLGLEI